MKGGIEDDEDDIDIDSETGITIVLNEHNEKQN